MTSSAATAGLQPAHALQTARALLKVGALQEAKAAVSTILQQAPDNIDALYLYAVICRYAGQSKPALTALLQLQQLAPTHARSYQEQGHLLKQTGQPEHALQAYQRALSFNPALAASLEASVELFQTLGQPQAAQISQSELAHLQSLPQPLIAVMELMADNKLLKAETLCRDFLQQHPKQVEGMRLLADIGIRLGVLEDAEFLLESAALFAPHNSQVQLEYVQVLRKRQKFEAALAQAQRLLQQQPDNLQYRSICAIEHMQTGDFKTALSMLDQVLAQVPNDAATLTTKGHALKTSGQTAQAIVAYQAACQAAPRHGEPYYALANLKTYQFSDAELAQMQQQLQSPQLGLMDRVHLLFALAKANDDRGNYAQAFAAYANGNDLKKAQSRYNADKMQAEFAALHTTCTPALFAQYAGGGHQAPDPIFVVGLPRAGSTLLEQILASHSQVDGTLELPNILSLSQRLRRRQGADGYPQVLTTLNSDELLNFGQEYLDDTQIHRGAAPHFVDKMPNNFRHIGLIKMILPNAKIIDARREPMACCFSGFKQLFAEGQEFSYTLDDIGRYYRDYVRLMTHWDQVLPGFVLRVNHEDVVADLEFEVRRLLDFCGLPFEAACLDFHKNKRNVRTPSSEQVRQPIFSDGLEQWRNFEPWLNPLRTALKELA